jgi:hypothetical protein
MVFRDFMDSVSLKEIARGDVGALKRAVEALNAKIDAVNEKRDREKSDSAEINL